jgi:zinc protease
MNTMRTRVLALASTLLFVAPSVLLAQAGPSKIDRSTPPAAAAPRALHVPAWTHITLANGAQLVVSPKHDLPLVSFTITWVGGADQYEPAAKTGLAGMTAAMLSEGTATRTGDQLSDATELLGTNVNTRIGGETGTMSFLATKAKYPRVLGVMADMLEHPAFPDSALERLRARTLVGLVQAKDQPTAIASNVFDRVLYGADHPYGRFETEAGVNAVTRADVVAFHDRYFTPGHALITVVGDVDPAAVKATVEQALAGWTAGGTMPSFDYPAVPAARPTTIYLVDKPKAPQSVFAIGIPGPPRSTPDYDALQVMNTILGGLFQSRLNHDIREVKGYSYGVGSRFAYGKGPGSFYAGGSIVSAKTDSALIAFMAHLKGVQGGVPFTDDEMAQGKAALIQRLPQIFASVNATSAAISALYVEGLAPDYYQTLADRINAVTKDDLVRVARKYIDLDHLNIVIVGDRSVIEQPLQATGIAPIVHLDIEGNPIPNGSP